MDSTQVTAPVIPKVFISYTHETSEHKAWVASLAGDLRRNGVEVTLDQWEVRLGDDLTLFMEGGIRSAQRVLLVCTPAYARKANEGTGGVGYERLVVTGEMAQQIATNKFVCILRSGTKETSLPSFAKARRYTDFTVDSDYAAAFDEMLRDIHNKPLETPPPLGPNPYLAEAAVVNISKPPLPDPDQVKTDLDPEILFSRSETLLRQHDLAGWKRLVRSTKRSVYNSLAEWRNRFENQIRETSQIEPAFLEALAACNPLMVLALSAVDSEISEIVDQRSLLDELLEIDGWISNGQTIVVEAPRALAFVYHHLLGSLLVSQNKHIEAIRLITIQIAERHNQGTKPLFRVHDLMGWPNTLEHDCAKSWSVVMKFYGLYPWISHFYTSEAKFQTAVRAYAMLSSVVELSSDLSQAASSNSAKLIPGTLDVPPMFLLKQNYSSASQSRVLSLAVPDAQILASIAERTNSEAGSIRTYFKEWVGRWCKWHMGSGRMFFDMEDNLALP